MNRNDILNALADTFGYRSYLEIGVNDGINFERVRCVDKIGVDPNKATPATFHITSDEFFKWNSQRFDLIFIDGLHEAKQVYRDIVNALGCLSDGGAIVCHDMNPPDEASQVVPRIQKHWNGDCWKAWMWLRRRDDLEMFVVNTDEGCGIIRRGKGKGENVPQSLDWNFFLSTGKLLLNLREIEQFDQWLKESRPSLMNSKQLPRRTAR